MYQPQPSTPPSSSSTRTIWVCWCLLWVAVWGILAIVFALSIVGVFVAILMLVFAACSALAILIPVGKPRAPLPPTPDPTQVSSKPPAPWVTGQRDETNARANTPDRPHW